MRYLLFFILALFISPAGHTCDSTVEFMENLRTTKSWLLSTRDVVSPYADNPQLSSIVNASMTMHYPLLKKTDLKTFGPFLGKNYPRDNVLTRRNLKELKMQMHQFIYCTHFIFLVYTAVKTLTPKFYYETTSMNTVSMEDFRENEQFISTVYDQYLSSNYGIIQKVYNKFAHILDHYHQLPSNTPCGILGYDIDLPVKMGFLRNDQDIVFFPFQSSRDGIEEIAYGLKDSKRRSIVIANGELVQQSCLVAMHWPDGLNIFHFMGAAQPTPFTRADYCFHIPSFKEMMTFHTTAQSISPDIAKGMIFASVQGHSGDPVLRQQVGFNDLLPSQQMILTAFNADSEDFLDQDCHICYLPETVEDEYILELLLIEDLIAAREDVTHPDHTQFTAAINNMETRLPEGQSIDDYVNHLEKSLVAKCTQQVTTGQSPNTSATQVSTTKSTFTKKTKSRKGKRRKGKGRKYSRKNAGTGRVKTEKQPDNSIESVAQQRAKAFKVAGRQKWRHVLRLVNQVIHDYPDLTFDNINITGSHITFHGAGKPLTLVPKHGKKDLTIPSGTVNNFVTQLIARALQGDINN